MAVPYIHAEASAKRFGGVPSDYEDIHILLDSTKETFSNNAHRILTHNSWFVVKILPLIFGQYRINSDGKKYSVKDVGEYHVLEDFRMRFIPTPQDWIENLNVKEWMMNGKGVPNRLKNKKEEKTEKLND